MSISADRVKAIFLDCLAIPNADRVRHLEAACEWLEEKQRIGKFSAPFGLTKLSRVEVEEPAYICDQVAS